MYPSAMNHNVLWYVAFLNVGHFFIRQGCPLCLSCFVNPLYFTEPNDRAFILEPRNRHVTPLPSFLLGYLFNTADDRDNIPCLLRPL